MSWEEQVLQELDSDIRRLAKHWSRDNPDEWEDLAQEARLAVALELRYNRDAPRTYLFRRAKHEILDYRKRGKSVDSKLDKTYKRQHVWDLVRLNTHPTQVFIDNGSLYFRRHQPSSVEDEAVGRLAYQELRDILTPVEDSYLSLGLQGYSRTEATALLGLRPYQSRKVLSSIRVKARSVFDPHDYR